MTNLSPAAQQVFWEFNRAASGKPDDWHYLPAIAAALRAAVDQAIPLTKTPWSSTLIPVLSAQESRDRILAIADELESL